LLDRLACAGSRGRVVGVREGPTRAPLVTVVVPCFNYGHYLPACVGSALNQPGVDVEVIVVDDASTDGSGEVAEELARTNPSIRVIRHLHNTGHLATYNDGLAHASGDYVVLLSADDLLTPGSLQRATALMEAHPGVGLVYGRALRFAEEVPPPARTNPTHWMIWSGHDWLAMRFKRAYNCILAPEAILRTAVQREIGGYRSELPHTADMEMWMRAAGIADVGYVSGADQAWYRDHGASMHNTTFQSRELVGLALDLRERMRTFELTASQLLGHVPEAAHWLATAHRTLAVEALTSSIRSYYRGNAGRWPVDELADVALELYPDARRLPHWKVLSLHRRIGPDRRRRDPASIGHHLMLRARGATRAWRCARAGL
jgi:Glycosyl transferase family 2